jgi:replication-associated recombination protein RarA
MVYILYGLPFAGKTTLAKERIIESTSATFATNATTATSATNFINHTST